MGTLRAGALVALSALAACGSDGKSNIDAMIILEDAAIDAPPDVAIDAPRMADLSCLGAPLPATAVDPVTLSGSAQTVNITTQSLEPVQDAVIIAFEQGVTPPIGTTMTDSAGSYSLSLDTGAQPLDGYVRGTKAGLRDTYLYPPVPVVADTPNGFLLMLNNTVFGLLASQAGVEQNAADGAFLVLLLDCSNAPIVNATVTATQNGADVGTVVYGGAGQFPIPDPDVTSTQDSGAAFVFNVPPGDTEVSAMVDGMMLRAHTVGSFAGSTTLTAIVP